MIDDLPAKIAANQKMRNQARLVIVLAVIGMGICSITGRDLNSVSFAKDWSVTEGVVLRSSIVRSHSFKFPYQTTIHPNFDYSYIVDGKTYESSDTSFDSSDEKKLGETVSKFPAGTTLQVHYRSSEPNVSYFEHEGVNKHTPYSLKNLFFILGLASMVAAMVLAIRMQKARKNERAAETRLLAK